MEAKNEEKSNSGPGLNTSDGVSNEDGWLIDSWTDEELEVIGNPLFLHEPLAPDDTQSNGQEKPI